MVLSSEDRQKRLDEFHKNYDEIVDVNLMPPKCSLRKDRNETRR
jgi:hypothetical protein